MRKVSPWVLVFLLGASSAAVAQIGSNHPSSAGSSATMSTPLGNSSSGASGSTGSGGAATGNKAVIVDHPAAGTPAASGVLGTRNPGAGGALNPRITDHSSYDQSSSTSGNIGYGNSTGTIGPPGDPTASGASGTGSNGSSGSSNGKSEAHRHDAGKSTGGSHTGQQNAPSARNSSATDSSAAPHGPAQ